LELTVPFVFVEDTAAATEAFPLPVTSPVETRLGPYSIRVLATRPVPANHWARRIDDQQPALAVELDLGDGVATAGCCYRVRPDRRRFLQHRVSDGRAGHAAA